MKNVEISLAARKRVAGPEVRGGLRAGDVLRRPGAPRGGASARARADRARAAGSKGAAHAVFHESYTFLMKFQ